MEKDFWTARRIRGEIPRYGTHGNIAGTDLQNYMPRIQRTKPKGKTVATRGGRGSSKTVATRGGKAPRTVRQHENDEEEDEEEDEERDRTFKPRNDGEADSEDGDAEMADVAPQQPPPYIPGPNEGAIPRRQ